MSFDNDLIALAGLRSFISYLPLSNRDPVPVVACADDPARADAALDSIVPSDSHQAYDVKEVVSRIVDEGSFMEVAPDYAKNIGRYASCLTHVRSHSDRICPNEWSHRRCHCKPAADILWGLGYCLLGQGCPMGSVLWYRYFIGLLTLFGHARTNADAFNIPLITFVDVPGFLPGREQEHGGIIRNGAKLLYAFAEATVPKITGMELP